LELRIAFQALLEIERQAVDEDFEKTGNLDSVAGKRSAGTCGDGARLGKRARDTYSGE
jgi:hypothetical protein